MMLKATNSTPTVKIHKKFIVIDSQFENLGLLAKNARSAPRIIGVKKFKAPKPKYMRLSQVV
jgi:hypothetical protein